MPPPAAGSARDSGFAGNEWAGLLLALCVTAALRLAWIGSVTTIPIADYAGYDLVAVHLARGDVQLEGGVSWSQYPPGYPLLLAGVYLFAGWSHLAAKLANALCALLAVGFTYLCGRAIWSPRLGLSAAWLLALFPGHVFYSALLASENLFVPLLMATTWLLVSCRSWQGAALTGVLSGWATLTRPQALYMPAIAFAILALRRDGWVKWVSFCAVLCLAMALTMSPWWLRNYLIFHTFVPTTTHLWASLYEGGPEAQPIVDEALARAGLPGGDRWRGRDAVEQVLRPAEEVLLRDRVATKAVLEWDRQHLAIFLAHTLRRLRAIYFSALDIGELYFTFFWNDPRRVEARMYGPEFEAARTGPQLAPPAVVAAAWLARLYYLVVLALAAWGMATVLWRCCSAGASRSSWLPCFSSGTSASPRRPSARPTATMPRRCLWGASMLPSPWQPLPSCGWAWPGAQGQADGLAQARPPTRASSHSGRRGLVAYNRPQVGRPVSQRRCDR